MKSSIAKTSDSGSYVSLVLRQGFATLDTHPICDCLRLLAPNLSGSLSLWRPNDECASGGFDDVFGDGVEVVDSQDAVDLGEEAVE